jgi:DNA modification methylase
MPTSIAQRADYTFKYNRSLGRHGWLRLTPAYSVKLVQGLMSSIKGTDVVLDPFAGTGTTVLAAAEHGNVAFGFDINPYLIWLANNKCRTYSDEYVAQAERRARKAVEKIENRLAEDNWLPPLFKIERWWSPHTLRVLGALRACLVDEFGEPTEDRQDGLAWIAFSRLAIDTSAAAFNHVSMSFHDAVEHYETDFVVELYLSVLDFVLRSAKEPIPGRGKVVAVDARTCKGFGQKVDRVITSPPYPNRISYIRELRPYMYWTRFLTDAREAGELDWTAVGGTWGVATSRLNTWQGQKAEAPRSLEKTVHAIASADADNAELLATYVHKYFVDMHEHLAALRKVLNPGASVNYIVGNSTFYGNLVPTETLYCESLAALGYDEVSFTTIRKRNSNRSLFEFDVTARWPG